MAEKPKLDANFKHIIRVADVDIDGNKQIRFALTKIKGIGINLADCFCKSAHLNRITKAGYLSDKEVEALNKAIDNLQGLPAWLFNRRKDFETGEDKHLLTGNLNFVHDNDLKRLKKIKTLRGVRHQKGLPVRGQRTRSNFRKSKGKVVGVVKKRIVQAAAAAEKDKKETKKPAAEKKK